MEKRNLNINLIVILLLIAATAFLRIFINIPNFTPIAAIALFGGTFIKRKELAILLPMLILFVSDIIIGFYSPMLMIGVYGSFILIGLLGFLLRKNVNIVTVISSSLIASILFFVVTNFVVWAEGLWYPLTLSGLTACFVSAIPFFRYEIMGTLTFSLFFFGAYSIVTKKIFAIN